MGDQPDPLILALVDQLLAAHRDVADVIGWLAPDRRSWRNVDEWTTVSVDDMLSQALAQHGRSSGLCPHAWASIVGGAPRPQVLDGDRGILACLEGCYLLLVTTQEPGLLAALVHCFDCGRPVGSHPLDNLLIAYGPVLVVGSLCERCDQDWPQGTQRLR